MFKISLLTYKTRHKKQPVYLHSVLAASLPSRSPRSIKGISLSVPRVKTNTGKSCSLLCLFETVCRCLFVQPFQLLPSRNISRHISLTWSFPLRHGHTWRPVDAKELFYRFAVEHWFGCRITEPGFPGNISAVEIWLIDWMVMMRLPLLSVQSDHICVQRWKTYSRHVHPRLSLYHSPRLCTTWQDDTSLKFRLFLNCCVPCIMLF